ncbi:MAG TPA: MalY/PatB family protein [Synergistaceae bacterium]|mgnify:CR=1 FL=1|nr:MalY/PatB family protein [Synergistaceae bacterium]HPQ37131.1 MalY/PatB family protein [Synergistaceae bacterium]
MQIGVDFDAVLRRRGTGSLKWDTGEENLFPMWVADMDFPAPPEVRKALEDRGAHGIFGYGAPGKDFFAAPAAWQERRHGWKCSEEWFLYAPGVVTALAFILQALTEEGAGIIIQPPVYYPFFGVIRDNRREIVLNPLRLEGNRYVMDFEDLEQKASRKDVTALVLCSPHNPVGRVWTEEELRRAGEICARHGVLVITDEIHEDLVLPGYRHRPFGSLGEDFAANSVTCVAPSKTFNLAGLQCSFIIVPDEKKRSLLKGVLDAAHLSRPNVFALAAAPVAFRECAYWVDELMAYVAENVAFLRDFLDRRLPRARLLEPEGTYLAWVDFRDYGFSREELERRMLEKGKIWLDEGYIFGDSGSGFERIVLACPRALLEEGLERIERAVKD